MGLFNTHHYHNRTEYVPYEKTVTVHEHKAPTDESVKLLNELDRKAKQNIIDSIHIQNNVMDCAVIYFNDEVIRNRVNYLIKFKLNNKDFRVSGFFDKGELAITQLKGGYRRKEVMELVYKKYTEAIFNELLKQTPDSFKEILD